MKSQTALVARQYRIQEWANMIRECNSRPVGMTVTEWCNQHSITKCDYYYRMKAVRKACLDTIPPETISNMVVPVPLEVMETDKSHKTEMVSDDASIELSTNGITLRVTNHTSSDLLAKVLGVIAHVE